MKQSEDIETQNWQMEKQESGVLQREEFCKLFTNAFEQCENKDIFDKHGIQN